jgi:hypothetical protein
MNKLKQLSSTDYKTVAKVAKSDPELAKDKLDEIIKVRASGSSKSMKSAKDQSQRRIDRLVDAKSAIKAELKDDDLSKYDRKKMEDVILDLEEVIEMMRGKHRARHC